MTEERRAGMTEVNATLGLITSQLAEMRENQSKMCGRLEDIERNINMVAGAWTMLKYIVALPVSAWLFYEWFRKHITD